MLTLEKLCYVQVLNSVGGPSVPEPLQASAPLAPRTGRREEPRVPASSCPAPSKVLPLSVLRTAGALCPTEFTSALVSLFCAVAI